VIALLSRPPRFRRTSTPLASIRAALGDSHIKQFQWSSDGVRVASTNVCVMDDPRCATSTGRYFFPGISGEYIDLGNLTNLNAATKVTIMVWFTPTAIADTRMVSRASGGTAATRQIELGVGSGGKSRYYLSTGSVNVDCDGSTTIAAGSTYKSTMVFDGTQGTNATRLAGYLAQRQSDGSYPADVAETITFPSAVPASLTTLASASAWIGTLSAASANFPGFIDEVRVWIGTALTQTQVRAETLSTNATPADLRYTFAGNANNSGTLSGFNGAPTSGVVQCSDDLSYGPPIVFTGTNRPTLVSSVFGTQGAVRFDGTDDYGLNLAALSGAKTIILAYKIRSTPASNTFYTAVVLRNGTLVAKTFWCNAAGYPAITFADDRTAAVATAGVGVNTTLDTNAHILARTFDGVSSAATSSYTAVLDGVAQTIVTANNFSEGASIVGSIGSQVVGGTPASAAPLDLAAIIITDNVVSAANLAAVRSALQSQFAGAF
jgi:hypothetical protein